jgi:branched-chain amino acid transport system permease protein
MIRTTELSTSAHSARPHTGRTYATVVAGGGALALLLLVGVPLAFQDQPYWLSVFTNAALLSLASLGVWVTFSIGRVNIAQGAFAMIGGYTVAILSTRYGLSFWLCLPLAGIVAGAVGVLIGWPILRLKGVYFAMVTLSLTEAVRLAFLNGGEFTQGSSGIVNIPRPEGVAGATEAYLLGTGLMLLGLLAVWRLANSRLGRVFHCMRQNEDLASSIGIHVARYRLIAFGFSCVLGGIAGGCIAALQQNMYPASYTVADSINFMLYCFFGGLDYVLGPLVGAVLLVVGFELLGEVQKYQALLYGILMIIIMLFLPNGVLSLALPRWGRHR